MISKEINTSIQESKAAELVEKIKGFLKYESQTWIGYMESKKSISEATKEKERYLKIKERRAKVRKVENEFIMILVILVYSYFNDYY